MSLSAWEQQTLDSIKDRLAGSDPQLAALLTTFTRLASDEEMPVQEEIPAGSGRTVRRSLRTPRHRRGADGYSRSRPRVQWVVMLVWLLVTVIMITVAVVMTSGGSQGACQGAWPACTHSAPG